LRQGLTKAGAGDIGGMGGNVKGRGCRSTENIDGMLKRATV
jgi:hypothetical protein